METLPRFRFGPFELDPGTFKLLKNGETVSLEPKGLDLLRLLLERAPRVVEKSEIFSIVWKDVAVTDNALTRLITQIRKGLEDDPKTPRYIETIATRGYRFVAAVSRLDDRALAPADLSPPVPVDRPPAPTRRFGRVPLAYAAVGALVVLSTAAFIGSRLGRKTSDADTWMVETPDVPRLAALKPEQISAGKSYDGYLAFAPDGKSLAFSSDRSGALEIFVQSAAQGSTSTPLTSGARQSVQPAWSPDGQFIAYHEMSNNGIWVMPSRGGVARKVADFGANPAWSPDGRWIAFQSLPVTFLEGFGLPGALSSIWLVEASGVGQPVQLTEPGTPVGPHLSPRWLQDSKHLLFAAPAGDADRGETSLWNIDIESRDRQRVVTDRRLSPDYVITPDGQAVYFVARGADTIWWMPLGPDGTWKADPQPTGLAVSASRIAHLTISADGHRIGWTGLEQSVQVWNASANAGDGPRANPSPLVQGLGVWYGLPAPSEDGRLLMVGERAGANLDLFLLAPRTPLRQLTVDRADHGGGQWMPGEREVAYFTELPEGRGYAAIDTESGRTRPLFLMSDLPQPPGSSQASTASPSTNLAFSRDFSRVAMAIVKDGRLNIWVAGLKHERPDGTLTQVTFEQDGGSYPNWSKDGRWIAYECNAGSDTNVCVTGSNGTDRKQLTREPGQSWVSGWKADNETVLFAAERHGVWNVQSISRTTGKVALLTQFDSPLGHVRYPRWDTANDRAVFQRSETTGRLWTVALPQ